MNETEIRRRVHAAVGDSPIPPDLTSRVASRLGRPLSAQAAPRLVSLVAALLAVAIVATLVLIRLQGGPGSGVPAEPPPPKPPAASIIGVSQADLDATQLSGDLVTPLKLSTTSSGRTVTLIGAYADSARTVLFFRSMPVAAFVHASIYDDTGLLNAPGTAGRGSIGDFYFILNTGPHAGPDGLANLRAMVDVSDTPPAKLTGGWSFAFAVSVGAFSHLNLQPALTAVGSWQVNVETMELTPTLIHFQAVINGATVADIKQNTLSLADPYGHVVAPVSESADIAGSSQATRVSVSWKRPTAIATYILTIVGGGATYHGTFAVPAPGSTNTKPGTPPKPTDYPASPESLTISGAFSTTIRTGRPTSCGYGSGVSGTLFGFTTLFQFDGNWYSVGFQTDPRVRGYTGPGTYLVEAQLSPLGASPIFEGPVELTVTSDRAPGPMTGTVRGTMQWTGDDTGATSISITGNWQCTWSEQLGPG